MTEPLWSRPRFVFSAIIAYLAVHLSIRMAMGPALSVDDSEIALFSQHFAWTYRYKAPPLAVWLMAALGQAITVDAFAIGLLRYLSLGALFLSIYLVARRLMVDPRLSALSVYSFAAINAFAESSHRNLTHTTLMTALLGVAWYVFVRLAAAPRLGWYLGLGAILGLGMLAKWNFVLFVLTLPLACLLDRQGRALVLTWKIVPASLLAAAIVLPSFVATVRIGPLPGEDVATVLRLSSHSYFAQVSEGTLKLLDTILIYSLPLLPLVVVIFAAPLWRGLRVGDASAEPPSSTPSATVVGGTMAIGIGLFFGLVLFLGATEFKVRYFHPVLLILPVWLFMVIERGRPSDRAINIFASVAAVLAVGVTAKRMATQFTEIVDCGLCLEMRPYEDLAEALRQSGYRGAGTILASDTVSGNLRVVFPDAHVIDPAYPEAGWAVNSGESQCMLVWDAYGGDAGDIPQPYAVYLAGALEGRLDAPHEAGVVSAPLAWPAKGQLSLGYWLYDGPNGNCG